MLSQKRIRVAGTQFGLSAVAALLVACQAPTAIAKDASEQTAMKMVYCQITIAVSGEGTDTKILDQVQLTTLENNKATLEFGQQVAVSTGATNLPGNRGISQSYRQQQVGTVVKIEPTIVGDQIVINLQLEKSWVEAPMSETQTDIASQYTTFSISASSALALSDGKPQILKAKVTGAPGGQREATISVTASTQLLPSTTAGVTRPDQLRSSKRTSAMTPRRPSDRGTPSRDGKRNNAERDHSGDNRSRADRPSPGMMQGQGVRRMFELIDRDKDGMISVSEWKGQKLAQSMESQGVKFSEKMDPKKFEAAVSEMVKGFRKGRDTKSESAKDGDES